MNRNRRALLVQAAEASSIAGYGAGLRSAAIRSLTRNHGSAEAGSVFLDSVLLHSSTRRNRSAFAITDTELRLIAALANTGLSSSPKAGYRMPAAIGTPSVL